MNNKEICIRINGRDHAITSSFPKQVSHPQYRLTDETAIYNEQYPRTGKFYGHVLGEHNIGAFAEDAELYLRVGHQSDPDFVELELGVVTIKGDRIEFEGEYKNFDR